MLNETLIILDEHGPEAKVFFPDDEDQAREKSVEVKKEDSNWLSSQTKITTILIKNIFLRLVKKVYAGTLASDEVLRALKMVSDLQAESGFCVAKIHNIIRILERIMAKAHQEHEVDEIREIISSLRFFEKTCGYQGG